MWVKLAAGKNKSMSRINWKSCWKSQISTGDYVAQGYKAPRLDTAGVSCHSSKWLAIAYLISVNFYWILLSSKFAEQFVSFEQPPTPRHPMIISSPHFCFLFSPLLGFPTSFFLSHSLSLLPPLCCIASVQPRPYRTTYPSNSDIRPFSVRMKEIQFLDVEKSSGDWRSWR